MTQSASKIADTAQYSNIAVIGACLRGGWADFRARPTVGFVLAVLYPIIGILLFGIAYDRDLFALLFPLTSAFMLVGPIALIGFHEISRRREFGEPLDRDILYRRLSLQDFGSAGVVGLVLTALSFAWLVSAMLLDRAIMPPADHASYLEFMDAVLLTAEGLTLVAIGCGIGFLFALGVLAVATLSPPAIIDRGLGPVEAMALSLKEFRRRPVLFVMWGGVVGLGFALGSLPGFLGLLVVLPVLGHSTWHFYRHLCPRNAMQSSP
ncbi:MAG: DUF2189 domain-containing protein [Pseudomonadota bacterium]